MDNNNDIVLNKSSKIAIQRKKVRRKKVIRKHDQDEFSITQLLSRIVKTPINNIIIKSHSIINDSTSLSQKININNILESSNDLLTIINDIVDYSSLLYNKYLMKNSDFSINDVIDNVISMLSNHAKNNNIIIKKKINVLPFIITHDVLIYKQILIKLISYLIINLSVGKKSANEILITVNSTKQNDFQYMVNIQIQSTTLMKEIYKYLLLDIFPDDNVIFNRSRSTSVSPNMSRRSSVSPNMSRRSIINPKNINNINNINVRSISLHNEGHSLKSLIETSTSLKSMIETGPSLLNSNYEKDKLELSLKIVKMLIQLIDGTIVIKNKKITGSTFDINIRVNTPEFSVDKFYPYIISKNISMILIESDSSKRIYISNVLKKYKINTQIYPSYDEAQTFLTRRTSSKSDELSSSTTLEIPENKIILLSIDAINEYFSRFDIKDRTSGLSYIFKDLYEYVLILLTDSNLNEINSQFTDYCIKHPLINESSLMSTILNNCIN